MRDQKTYFFPEVIRVFFKHRVYEVTAFFLILCTFFCWLSLSSYRASDPSLNTISSSEITENLMQIPGAYFSDLILQTIGNYFYLSLILLTLWAFQFLRHQPPSKFFLKIITAVIALSALTIGLELAVSLFVSHQTMPIIPFFFLSLIHLYAPPETLMTVKAGIAAFFLCSGVIGFIFASGLPYETLRKNVLDLANHLGMVLLGTYQFLKQKLANRARVIHESKRVSKARMSNSQVEHDISKEVFGDHDPSWPSQGDSKKHSGDAPQKPITEPFIEPEYAAPAPFKKNHHKPLKLNEASDFQLPSLNLLQTPDPKQAKKKLSPVELEENMERLSQVLLDYGIKGSIIGARPGPVVTLYELEPAPGIKSSRVIGLADDIARSMSALSARIAVVPGQNLIGIELPNEKRQTVFLQELLEDDEFSSGHQKLSMTLGKNIGGKPVFADLARMPHMIVAGTTGSGKSVGINAMILSLLYNHSPETCRLILIDPKMLEFSMYNDIPHLLTPVVTDPKKALFALKWAVREMENRYRSMSHLGVRNIEGYNEYVKEQQSSGQPYTKKIQTGFDPATGRPIFEDQEIELKTFPYIVVVVDEMADLMMVAGKDIEAAVQRLAQMARAAGIHVIMATQRPSVDVITGTIKANFPTRISFQVTSKFDSRTILGEQGAEQLLGRGDMLFMEAGGRIQRIHGPFVSDQEVDRVVSHLKSQGEPEYSATVTDDAGDLGLSVSGGAPDQDSESDQLYRQAVEIVRTDRKASTSYLQRKLAIGYNRAARVIEQMETEGLISPANHVGKREILMDEAS